MHFDNKEETVKKEDKQFLDVFLSQLNEFTVDIFISDDQLFIRANLANKCCIIKKLKSIDLSIICPNPKENIFWIQREIKINDIIDIQRAYLIF